MTSELVELAIDYNSETDELIESRRGNIKNESKNNEILKHRIENYVKSEDKNYGAISVKVVDKILVPAKYKYKNINKRKNTNNTLVNTNIDTNINTNIKVLDNRGREIINPIQKADYLQRKYVCKICKKRFRRLGGYMDHYNLHIKNYKFKCEKCNRGFVQKTNYNTHCKYSMSCGVLKNHRNNKTKPKLNPKTNKVFINPYKFSNDK